MGYIGAGITRFNTADELTVTGDATFDTNTLYVDSANNRVGIGTTGPVRALDIATTTGGTIIHLTDDSTGHLATDGVDIQQEGTLFQILNREAGDIRLGTNGSERLRIDSSGNLLVGKTANSIAGAGIVIRGGGELFSTRAGDVAGFNRLTTDGPIVQFYKDGSVVGGVGNDSSNLFINFSQTNNVGVAAGTSGGNPVLFPTGNTGAVRDDAVSLGYSSGRFKDLYLSGSATLANITNGAGEKIILNSDNIAFQVQASEAARLDASGNFVVGDTSAYATNAVTIADGGILYSRRTSGGSLTLRRDSTDGALATLEKDGTTVATIGAKFSGRGYIASGTSANTGVRFDTNFIAPADATGANRDNAINLGSSGDRFKDLYLSGGVYLGGTGSANLLDDYEEGTWTPTISAGGANPTVTYNTRTGHYTKVGNLVTLWMRIQTNSFSGGAGSIFISGVPFTEDPSGSNTGRVFVTINSMAGDYPSVAVVNSGNLFLYYRTSANSGDTNLQPSDFDTGASKNEMQLTVSYRTT